MYKALTCLVLSLSLFLGGCYKYLSPTTKYVSESSLEYTHHEHPNALTVIRHVYIDPSFKTDTKRQILAGMEEWNVVFNGYEKFVLGTETPPFVGGLIHPSPFDFFVVNISPKDADDMEIPDGVLGWVDDLGDPIIHLIEYRMVDENVRVLFDHELGHALGLPHIPVQGTLMYPWYPNSACVDETTVRALVSVRKGQFSLSNMNWCAYKP